MFTTKEAVRLGLPGYAQAIEFQCARPGRAGDRLRRTHRGGTPLWQWIGEEDATVFSY